MTQYMLTLVCNSAGNVAICTVEAWWFLVTACASPSSSGPQQLQGWKATYIQQLENQCKTLESLCRTEQAVGCHCIVPLLPPWLNARVRHSWGLSPPTPLFLESKAFCPSAFRITFILQRCQKWISGHYHMYNSVKAFDDGFCTQIQHSHAFS